MANSLDLRPRIKYHYSEHCWMIYVYDSVNSGGDHGGGRASNPENGIVWWPLEWMRFDTYLSAAVYLDIMKVDWNKEGKRLISSARERAKKAGAPKENIGTVFEAKY